MARIAVIGFLAASGCRRYADFTLPELPGGDSNLSFTLEAQTNPVFTPGKGWDAGDVLNPSVIRSEAAMVRGAGASRNRGSAPTLLNLYSGFDGRTWHTGLATSDDGLHWMRAGRALSPDPQTWEGSYSAANGSALFYDQQIWYWYVAGPKETPSIGLARAGSGPAIFGPAPSAEPDAAGAWRKEPKPVLEPGPYRSWDEYGVADPYVIRIGPYFYMYYLGQDRAHADRRRQRLGVARSADGIHFEKLRSNPVLDLGSDGAFDEGWLGEPAVWNWHGFYWMLYTGRDRGGVRRLGLARSTDGVHWQRLAAVFAGAAAWDSQTLCDPTVLVEDDTIRVWFGGGDVASPDENLHGRIGYGVLRPVNATLSR